MSGGSDWDTTADRWLAERHKVLVHDLAAILDLEAGMREAMIPARHDNLVADLRDTLDLESGLDAIVRGSVEDIPEISSGATTPVPRGSGKLNDLIHDLSSNSPRDLLEFRTHTIWSDRVQYYRCGCVRICALIVDLVSANVRAIEQALDATRDPSFRTARSVGVARLLVSQLVDLLEHTREFDQVFNADINRVRKVIDDLVRVLDIGEVLPQARDLAESLKRMISTNWTRYLMTSLV